MKKPRRTTRRRGLGRLTKSSRGDWIVKYYKIELFYSMLADQPAFLLVIGR